MLIKTPWFVPSLENLCDIIPVTYCRSEKQNKNIDM